MQLFLLKTPPSTPETVTLSDAWLVYQMSRVLRMRSWDRCALQRTTSDVTTRAIVTLTSIDRTQITTSIESIDYRDNHQIRTRCAVAFPNKFSKLELIVQKLTELSVDEIILFGAERSQPMRLQEKRLQRINTIIKEATEQSRWRQQPVLSIYPTLTDIPVSEQCVVADIPDHRRYFGPETIQYDPQSYLTHHETEHHVSVPVRYIWPEWWRWARDYEFFAQQKTTMITLWDTVLRMETAAVVCGFLAGL